MNDAKFDLKKRQEIWGLAHVGILTAVVVFYMLWPVNIYLWKSIYESYYVIVIPILSAFFLFFRGWRDNGIEIKTAMILSLWIFLTRILNGDVVLKYDIGLVHTAVLAVLLISAGSVLTCSQRKTFLNLFSAIVCIFYFAAGLIGIYASLKGLYIANPITQATVCSFEMGRLSFFDFNPNGCAVFFFVSFFLLARLFFAAKKWAWRIPIAAAAIVDYIVIAFIKSRNIMLALSVCLSLLIILIIFERRPQMGRKGKIIAAVSILLIVTPLVYCSLILISRITGAQDVRGLSSNGRLEIYRCVFYTFRDEPICLLKGSLFIDSMTIANNYISSPVIFNDAHNAFLQVLLMTGLPGFLMLLFFAARIAIKMLRYFFSPDDIGNKVLSLPVLGLLSYNMLESSLFVYNDLRMILFCFIAGFALVYSDDICVPEGGLAV